MDSVRYPRNKSILSEPESIYQVLAGYSTSLSSISLPDSSSQFKQYTFKSNPGFSSGVPSKNGILELNISFSGTIPTILETIIEYDAMLLLSQNSAVWVTDV